MRKKQGFFLVKFLIFKKPFGSHEGQSPSRRQLPSVIFSALCTNHYLKPASSRYLTSSGTVSLYYRTDRLRVFSEN